MKNKFTVLLLFSLFAFAAATDSPAVELPPTPVKVAEVKTEDVEIILHGVGHVEGYKEISIKSRINGKISAVFITDGAMVREGDKLFEIDRQPYILAVDQAEANLAKAQAQADEAAKIAAISEKLFSKDIVAKEKMEEQEAQAEELKSEVKVAQASLATARQNLSYCTILSPISGMLGRQQLYKGSLVAAYQDILITLNQIDKIKVAFSLPASKLQELQKYQQGTELPVTVYTRDNPEKTLTGKLNFINNQINPDTSMFSVQAVFENKDSTFWPGQYVHADIRITNRPDSLIIPARCLFNGPDSKMVYVINKDNKAEIRPVKFGWYRNDDAIILSGLKKDEKVVSEGIFKLYPTATVAIIPDKKPVK